MPNKKSLNTINFNPSNISNPTCISLVDLYFKKDLIHNNEHEKLMASKLILSITVAPVTLLCIFHGISYLFRISFPFLMVP